MNFESRMLTLRNVRIFVFSKIIFVAKPKIWNHNNEQPSQVFVHSDKEFFDSLFSSY